ncbi:DUF4249 domain-containing protein [Schleiferiaceae bacterium]|nr:DUF4249 domain-containing protein [Schleiferiaceae bacterium]
MKKFAIFSLLTLAFTSCEVDVTDKVITDAYDGAALISVSGSVTNIPGTGTYMDLAISSPYLDTTDADHITGALVEVYDNDSLVSTLTEVDPGRYEDSTLLAAVGHGYRIIITVPAGYGDATGIWESTADIVNAPFTFLSPMFPIMEDDSSWVDFRTGDSVYYADADSCYYSPYALWNDPAGRGNAYWIKNYWTTKIYAPNGLMGPFTPEETEKSLNSSINIFNDDQFIEGTQVSRFNFIGPPYTVFRDTLINLVFETRTVSEGMYDYLNIMANNIGGGGLFSVPYSPQIGNIRRQDDTTVYGLGYFYATSVRFDSITLFHPY